MNGIVTSWQMFRRGMRCARIVRRDPRLPWWEKGLLIVGCIQIPVLPTDEICLALGLLFLALRFRHVLSSAWVLSEAPEVTIPWAVKARLCYVIVAAS
jgi:hypothetical protein